MDGDVEARYKELLAPIKELASNWDVDIAEALTEYLEELEEVRVSLDGGRSQLNFAEAALLIQGSTAIYSKKVEYLHQLVLQSLEQITQQKQTARGGKGAKEGATGAAGGGVKAQKDQQKAKINALDDERFLFGSDPAYLLLDDFVEEAANIDLNVDGAAGKSKDKRAAPAPKASSHLLMSSIFAEDHGSNSLKLSSCLMNLQGALVIGGLPQLSTGLALRGSYGGAMFGGGAGAGDERMEIGSPGGGGVQEPQVAAAEYEDYGAFPGFDDGGDDDNEPFELAGVEALAALPEMPSGEIEPAAPVARVAAPSPVAVGSLALMDPHEVVPGSRAAKRGRTFRLPASLQKAAGESSAPSSSSSSASAKRDASTFSRLLAGDVPTRGLLHNFLAPVLREQRRARLAQVRSDGKQREQRADRFFYRPDADLPPLPVPAAGGGGGTEAGDDDDFAGGGGGGAHWGDDDDELEGDYGGDYAQPGYGGPFSAGDDEANEQSIYVPVLEEEDHLRMRMERVLDEGLGQTGGPSVYETLCRRHIDAFMRGAELYARWVESTRAFRVTGLFMSPSHLSPLPSSRTHKTERRSFLSVSTNGPNDSSRCCRLKKKAPPSTFTHIRIVCLAMWPRWCASRSYPRRIL